MLNIGNYKLRKLQISDKENLVKYGNNYEIWLNLTDNFPHPYTNSDAEWFIEYCNNQTNEFNLCIDFEGEFIGMMGVIFNTGIRKKTVEFGYWLAQPFWGKGITTQCSKKFIEYIFANYDIIRIQSSVFEWNKASMKVLEKVGFKLEGILKNAILKNEKIADEFKYAILKEDFTILKKSSILVSCQTLNGA